MGWLVGRELIFSMIVAMSLICMQNNDLNARYLALDSVDIMLSRNDMAELLYAMIKHNKTKMLERHKQWNEWAGCGRMIFMEPITLHLDCLAYRIMLEIVLKGVYGLGITLILAHMKQHFAL